MKSFRFLPVLLFIPSLAHAHVLQGDVHGFTGGLQHPLHGWDHILAMIAVGLWAAQMGGRSLWAVPCSFVGIMTLGGVLGMAGVNIPFVEKGIVASVLVLGVLITASVRLPLAVSMILVGFFAVFHGYAHGAEMPNTVSGIEYGLGFVFSTALLHVCGISLSLLASRFANVTLLRYAGAAIVLGGLSLCFA